MAFGMRRYLVKPGEKKPLKVIGRSTAQHREGKSVNTESVCVYLPRACVLHSGREEGGHFINMI